MIWGDLFCSPYSVNPSCITPCPPFLITIMPPNQCYAAFSVFLVFVQLCKLIMRNRQRQVRFLFSEPRSNSGDKLGFFLNIIKWRDGARHWHMLKIHNFREGGPQRVSMIWWIGVMALIFRGNQAGYNTRDYIWTESRITFCGICRIAIRIDRKLQYSMYIHPTIRHILSLLSHSRTL